MYQIVLDLLRGNWMLKSTESNKTRIFRLSYRFLKRFCMRHETNQLALYKAGTMTTCIKHMDQSYGADRYVCHFRVLSSLLEALGRLWGPVCYGFAGVWRLCSLVTTSCWPKCPRS